MKEILDHLQSELDAWEEGGHGLAIPGGATPKPKGGKRKKTATERAEERKMARMKADEDRAEAEKKAKEGSEDLMCLFLEVV